MSDGLSEAYRGTYFKDRSKLPFGCDIREEKEKKPKFWKRVINKIKQLWHYLNLERGG